MGQPMMADLRLPYVRTAMAGLASNPDRESAVDVVGAAGRAPKKGRDLWKLGYGRERSSYARLFESVLKSFRARYKNEAEAERVVEQAIHEYCNAACDNCTGTGKVGSLDLDKPQVVCPVCDGHAIKRYDNERRAQM